MTTDACRWCGSIHRKCPLVKAEEFYETGELKRVEFFTPVDYGPSAGEYVKRFDKYSGKD